MNVLGALAIFFALTFLFIAGSIHKIDEGHVGVYWRGGALVNRVTEPGFHLKFPFIDHHESVQVTVQTDKVTNIPCGTSGGVMITFDRVEVTNRLKKEHVYETIKNYTTHYDKIWIYDKIHHEINQFCSKHTLQDVYVDLFHTVDERLVQAIQDDCNKWAPGIEIISIRITKPKLPQTIMNNYEKMEAEKTRFMIAQQTQKVIEKEAETDRIKATIEAQKAADISKIQMQQQILEKESMLKMTSIEDESFLHREKTRTDAQVYQKAKEVELNQKLFTVEYLQLKMIESVASNTKIYFGSSPIAMFSEWMDKLSAVVKKD